MTKKKGLKSEEYYIDRVKVLSTNQGGDKRGANRTLGNMKRKLGEFGGFHPFLDHLLDGQQIFGLLDGVKLTARIRMTWDK